MAANRAKLTVDEKYIRPKKANDLMKSAQNIHQTVYIFGTTGFGKTSFVTDYFARRKYEYYSAADADFMETNLISGSHLEKERIIVLDDLQLLKTTEDRDAWYQVLDELMKDPKIWLILISRAPIPAWMKPLHIEHLFVIIPESALAFSQKEEESYLDQWQLSIMSESMKRIHQYGHGQPLFFKIMAMRFSLLPKSIGTAAQRLKEETEMIETTRLDCWDYLESHVYDLWDVEMQEFLMDISVVDTFDLQMAQMITKRNDAGKIIVEAQETGNFIMEIVKDNSIEYVMRPQMILSMRRRLLKKSTKTHIENLYYRAGNCYEMQGQITKALEMYQKCDQKESMSRLLIENARNHPGTGHYWELRKYYLSLPEEIIRQSAVLMAAISMLQSIMMNDEESERWYQTLVAYAKTQTGSAKKEAQARLFYLDVALPHRGTVNMKEILVHIWQVVSDRNSYMPEVSLTNNQPSCMNGGKDFCEWSKNDKQIALTAGRPIELVLGKFGKGLVNLCLAESYFEKGKDNYEVAMLAGKGRMQAESGGKPEQVFVAVGILAQLSIMNNHINDALESIDSFEASCQGCSEQLILGIHTFKIRTLLLISRTGEIAKLMEEMPDEDQGFCTLERYRYVTKARVYLSMGRKEKALMLLETLLLYAQKRDRIYLQIETKILLAITNYRMGNPKWKEIIQDAVSQAEEYHFVRVLSREGAPLYELLKSTELTWKDRSFQKQVLAESELMANMYPSYLKEKKIAAVTLSDTAVKILRMQAEGMNVAEIADSIGLSKAGVKYYNQETYKKLGVSSKGAAINEARNQKLI